MLNLLIGEKNYTLVTIWMAGFPNNNQNRRKRIYYAHKIGVVTRMREDVDLPKAMEMISRTFFFSLGKWQLSRVLFTYTILKKEFITRRMRPIAINKSYILLNFYNWACLQVWNHHWLNKRFQEERSYNTNATVSKHNTPILYLNNPWPCALGKEN